MAKSSPSSLPCRPQNPPLPSSTPLLPSILLLLTVLFANPWASATAQDDPLRAVATVGMVGDMVAEVGGECVDASWIMGSGVDPHLYQASARDVSTLQQAQIIFYAGLSLEGQLGEVLAGFARRTPTVAVAEELSEPEDLIETDDAYGVDPHLWMDVGLWAKGIPVIEDALLEQRPDCADTVRANASRYSDRLLALDSWVREAVATIPAERRVLVTAHDAFAYFGRAYDIEVWGIQGVSTESEAGVTDIRETARLVAERRIPAIFVESTINPRTVQAVVEAARRLGHEVTLGEQLFSDAMGEEGTAQGSYIGMLHANTRAVVDGLGGELPPLPEQLTQWASEWGIEGEASR